MKLTIAALSILLSLTSFASAELYCKSSNGTLTPMSDEENFAENCHDKMYVKDAVCFTGSRKDTIALINELDEWDLYGGEAYFVGIHYKGKYEVAYKIWDGPNDMLMYDMSIKRCD